MIESNKTILNKNNYIYFGATYFINKYFSENKFVYNYLNLKICLTFLKWKK